MKKSERNALILELVAEGKTHQRTGELMGLPASTVSGVVARSGKADCSNNVPVAVAGIRFESISAAAKRLRISRQTAWQYFHSDHPRHAKFQILEAHQ